MNDPYTQKEAAEDEWGDFVNRCTIAVGQTQDIAAEYDELASQVAHLRDRLRSMATYTVEDPQQREKEMPRLLRSPGIERVHQDTISELDMLEIQIRGRAGAWRVQSVQYDALKDEQ